MGQYLPVVCLLVRDGVQRSASSRPVARLRRPSSAASTLRMRHRAQSRASERFGRYVVAMLFVMFDIELIFIYPCGRPSVPR
jgi:hypothetical protein